MFTRSVSRGGGRGIRADSFQIVRIESEMVNPMPQIQLLSEHQVVEYAPAKQSRNLSEQKLTIGSDLGIELILRAG